MPLTVHIPDDQIPWAGFPGWERMLQALELPGPWQGEPNAAKVFCGDLPGLMLRGTSGSWNGYLGIPKGHPAFELDYADGQLDWVCVHGGVTYSRFCEDHDLMVGLPGAGFWWIGFDCAHYLDLVPIFVYTGVFVPSPLPGQSSRYWSVKDVANELSRLATQIAQFTNEPTTHATEEEQS